MLNTESVLKNEMHKILWEFEQQTYPLVTARKEDLVRVIKKEKSMPNRELWRSGGPQSEYQTQQKETQAFFNSM